MTTLQIEVCAFWLVFEGESDVCFLKVLVCMFYFNFCNYCFQLMPKLIFFNAAISALYYLGLVQIFIAKFGKFLSFCIGTSPIESVNAASNLFLAVVSDHSLYV